MNHAFSVGELERLRDLNNHRDRDIRGLSAPIQGLLEIAALQEVLDHVRPLIFCLTQVMNSHDARMRDRSYPDTFALEPLASGRVSRQRGQKDLRREPRLQSHVLDLVDFAEAAAPDQSNDPILAELRTLSQPFHD